MSVGACAALRTRRVRAFLAIRARHVACDKEERTLRGNRHMTLKVGIRDGAISAAVFGVVMFGLVSTDPRVRDHVSDLFGGSAAVSPWGDRVSDLGSALLMAAREQSIDNAPLLVFATVGAVLTLFMLKS